MSALVCPSCGYDGAPHADVTGDAFTHIESRLCMREIVIQGGEPLLDDSFESYATNGFDEQLQCGKCEETFPIPEGLTLRERPWPKREPSADDGAASGGST